MMKYFFGTMTLLAAMMAVGSIDGPTGAESANWLGALIFSVIMIMSGVITIGLSIKQN